MTLRLWSEMEALKEVYIGLWRTLRWSYIHPPSLEW